MRSVDAHGAVGGSYTKLDHVRLFTRRTVAAAEAKRGVLTWRTDFTQSVSLGGRLPSHAGLAYRARHRHPTKRGVEESRVCARHTAVTYGFACHGVDAWLLGGQTRLTYTINASRAGWAWIALRPITRRLLTVGAQLADDAI